MKKLRIRIAFCLVILVAISALTGCTNKAGTQTADEAANQFRVGMECAYAPFNWTQLNDANGAVKIGSNAYAGGYDVEIAKRIAEGLGRELVIVKTEWDGLTPALTSGKIDAIIAGMSATEERKQTLDFTDNYYTSNIVIVVRKDSPYANAKSIHDFSGAKITGQLSTLHYDFIDQMDGVDKQPAMEDFPTMVVAVNSGKIDGYTTERPGALSAVSTNPDLTFIEFAEENGFSFSHDEVSIAVGLQKNSPLKEEINSILAEISEDERQKLMEQAVLNQPSAE